MFNSFFFTKLVNYKHICQTKMWNVTVCLLVLIHTLLYLLEWTPWLVLFSGTEDTEGAEVVLSVHMQVHTGTHPHPHSTQLSYFLQISKETQCGLMTPSICWWGRVSLLHRQTVQHLQQNQQPMHTRGQQTERMRMKRASAENRSDEW